MFPYEKQNEPGGQPAPHLNQHWQPVPILWLEEVRFEVLDIHQAGTGQVISQWPRQSGTKCGERLRLKFSGGFRPSGHPLHEGETGLRDATRPTQPKIRP